MCSGKREGAVTPIGTKILLLADNPGREYVARIQTGAGRHASRTSYELAMENVYDSKRRLEDVLDRWSAGAAGRGAG